MAVIIEDGSQVVNANSFASDAEYTAYATLKGYTIGATAVAREIELITGLDYLLSRETEMQGVRQSSTQELFYPRLGVCLHGYTLGSDIIPPTLKKAQMEAAVASISLSLLPTESVNNVQSEKVDVIETSYFKGGKNTKLRLDKVNTYLTPLLTNNNKLVRT